MADATQTKRFRFWLWLIRVIGVIVPRRMRADWRQEWEAELRHRERLLVEWDRLGWRNKLELLRRSLSAFWDALVLQPQRLEDEMFQDLRFGVRMLLKHPGFTAVAVLTLALGIGANTAIFSVVNAVLLRPLPFAEPERLVSIAETHPEIHRVEVATPDFEDWRQQAQSFTDMAAWSLKDLGKTALTEAGEPEQLQSTCVTPNLFPLLGIGPALGRNFLPEENQSGRDRVAIVSYGLWRRRFAADPNLVGRTIRLNSENHIVVGVMPQDTQLPFDTDVWLPLSQLRTDLLTNRVRHPLEVVARLKAGATVEQARAEMEAIAGRLGQAYPATNKTIGVTLAPLLEQLTGDLKPALLALFGTVGLVLLITCSNVTNLLLGRATERQREVAVRAALGAGRVRLFRQFLTETMLLAWLGGGGGLLLAICSLPLLRAALPGATTDQLPALKAVSLDLRMLGFTLFVTTLTGALFGLIPAFQLSRLNLNQTLKEGAKASAGGARRRASRALVIAEVALTTVALVCAGLLLRSFQRLTQVDPGFRADHLLSAQLTLPGAKYQNYEQVKSFHQRLLPRIAALPGVEGVATIDNFPLTASNAKTRFAIEGAPRPAPGQFPTAQIRAVSHDYFRVMGIALKRGRVFTEDDLMNTRVFQIINETLARRYFPNEDPIGKKLLNGVMFPNPVAVPIIGVVADVKDLGLAGPVEPTIYGPVFSNRSLLMIRTTGEPVGLAATLRQAVSATDGEQPVHQIRTMEEALSISLARRRLSALLTGAFAALALLLAAIGIYGVLAWTVSERAREIAVRLALGAQTGDVLKLVVSQGMKLTLLGLAIGLAASLPVAGAMKSLLFGVGAGDPTTFAVIALLLVLTALLACYLPARKAAKVDPAVAMRQE
ncbi:MAG TPA: ABC transporter permease [Blastocatellia bacterium]|nr:ABC transporter permease [Blastocatellia bacterium]